MPSDDVQFCPSCGSALSDIASVSGKDTAATNHSDHVRKGMKTSTKIGIVVLTILVVIIIGGISIFALIVQHTGHKEFCKNWFDQNEKEKARLASELFPSETDRSQVNNEIANYNKECAY